MTTLINLLSEDLFTYLWSYDSQSAPAPAARYAHSRMVDMRTGSPDLLEPLMALSMQMVIERITQHFALAAPSLTVGGLDGMLAPQTNSRYAYLPPKPEFLRNRPAI